MPTDSEMKSFAFNFLLLFTILKMLIELKTNRAAELENLILVTQKISVAEVDLLEANFRFAIKIHFANFPRSFCTFLGFRIESC